MIDVRKVLEIGRVNLVRQVRDRSDLFFVLVLPIIIIVALGLQFGGSQLARLGVVAPIDDPAAAALVADLAGSGQFEVRRIGDEATLRSEVERSQLEAGLVIPAGFGEALRGPGTASIQYLGTTEALTRGLRAPVEAAVSKLAAITTAARVAEATGAGSIDQALSAAQGGFAAVPGVQVEMVTTGEPGLFTGFSMFTFGATTQLVMFMFLTSMTSAANLVFTRQIGVSRRMISTPTSATTIVAGEALGRYGVALFQALLIVAITSIVFGVSWGDPLAAGAIIALFGVVAAGAAMLAGATSRSADQTASLGVFLGLTLGALGGCMVPLQVMPPTMQTIAHLIPQSWALLGLQSLITDGGGIASVAQNLAVLAGYAIVLMGVASWRFRKAIAG